jgi:hypothetical protein
MLTILTAQRQLSWPVEAGNKSSCHVERAFLAGKTCTACAAAGTIHDHFKNIKVMNQSVYRSQRHRRLQEHLLTRVI